MAAARAEKGQTMSSASSAVLHGSDKAAWDAAHVALRENIERWCCCAFVGLQIEGQTLQELRLCPDCGTTLARPLSTREAVGLLVRLIETERLCLDVLGSAGQLVGQLLHEQRLRLGLTRRKLAGQLSLSVGTLIKIERGVPRIESRTVHKLLGVLAGALPLASCESGHGQR
jgi:DNA-binding XRE family transcriptional regulator